MLNDHDATKEISEDAFRVKDRLQGSAYPPMSLIVMFNPHVREQRK
jgi:hypothetical protein